jgi:peptide/nickel transport system permease protein
VSAITVAARSAELLRPAPPRRSSRLDVLRALGRDRLALLGIALFLLVFVAAVGAPLLAPYDPTAVHVVDRLKPPSAQYLLGTDELGRDTLSRIIYGARASFSVGVVAVAISLTFGVLLGLLGGYYGGLLDTLISRVLDALIAFPSIILALAIVTVLGPSLVNVMLAIGVVSIPGYARITRGSVLAIREQEFVLAGRASGASDVYLMTRTVLPNCLSPLLVQASVGFANAILAEAALSFLGLGVQPPTPSWGGMLDTGRHYLSQTAWYSFSAGAASFVSVLSLNLVGDALRDALDPRLRRRT